MVATETISTLSELVNKIEIGLNNGDGPRWFRGSGNYEDHELIPTLFRHPDVKNGTQDPLQLEDRLHAKFEQTSPPFIGAAQPKSKFEQLFLEQHYGIPTRLLDWSENPFIALYFALSSQEKGKTPCVWELDPIALTRASLNNPGLARIPEPRDNAAQSFLEQLRDPIAPRNDPIAIYANHTNPRIVAQRGTFTIFGVGKIPLEKLSYASSCLKCYLIDASVANDLLRKITSIGYTHSVIYPDLSGLGAEIKALFKF